MHQRLCPVFWRILQRLGLRGATQQLNARISATCLGGTFEGDYREYVRFRVWGLGFRVP